MENRCAPSKSALIAALIVLVALLASACASEVRSESDDWETVYRYTCTTNYEHSGQAIRYTKVAGETLRETYMRMVNEKCGTKLRDKASIDGACSSDMASDLYMAINIDSFTYYPDEYEGVSLQEIREEYCRTRYKQPQNEYEEWALAHNVTHKEHAELMKKSLGTCSAIKSVTSMNSDCEYRWTKMLYRCVRGYTSGYNSESTDDIMPMSINCSDQ